MAGVAEAAGSGNEFASVLTAATDTISQNQTLTFTRYVRVVLPLDGYVFWAKSGLLSASALLNAAAFNTAAFNQPQTAAQAAETVQVKGSLHYTTDNQQDETEGFATDHVVFTSEVDIDELNTINPATLFIAEIDGIRFSFSRRAMFYRQSGLYHYQGDAVYPTMETQLLDTLVGFDSRNVVVSNSLPVWLSLNRFMPMFPSFLVPDNVAPPYCAVHIQPDGTRALQSAPYIDAGTGSHYQLAADRVRLTIYGLRNFNALDFLDYVLDYSANTDAIGIMNMPIPRDEKRTQAELNTLAMKKTIEFEVSYLQARVREIGLQHINSAFLNLLPE